MGLVWAARQQGALGFSRIVAIKTALPDLASDPAFEAAFLEEAAIASRIKHPNVCPILDVGEDGGVLYAVMEWIDGEPLSVFAKSRNAETARTPDGVAAWVLARAARGLQAAHELTDETGVPYGVVHRDVSPQNIMVTAEALVQVVDFGIAKAALGTGTNTRSGYLKGKVPYLAPEQVRGDRVDARADVFALGIVLFELTVGAHPFLKTHDVGTLLEIGSARPAPSPHEDVAPGLRRVLARALEKCPEQRYPSMREVAADLEAYAASVGVGEDEAKAYLGEALGERRTVRWRTLRDAARAADERAAIVTRNAPGASRHPAGREDREPGRKADEGTEVVRGARSSSWAVESPSSAPVSDARRRRVTESRVRWASFGICCAVVLRVAAGFSTGRVASGAEAPSVAAATRPAMPALPSGPGARALPLSVAAVASPPSEIGATGAAVAGASAETRVPAGAVASAPAASPGEIAPFGTARPGRRALGSPPAAETHDATREAARRAADGIRDEPPSDAIRSDAGEGLPPTRFRDPGF